jgi:disulfide bond formation protein DsbB
MPYYAQVLTTLFAVSTLIVSFLLVVALCYRIAYGAWAPPFLKEVFVRHGLLLASIAPVFAFFLSLWYEALGFVPCPLCWFTRTMMYPLAIILPIAVYKKDTRVSTYAFPLIFVGSIITLYQHLLQLGLVSEGVCEALGSTSCATRYVFEFNFVTLPFFGLVAFLVTAYFLRVAKRD